MTHPPRSLLVALALTAAVALAGCAGPDQASAAKPAITLNKKTFQSTLDAAEKRVTSVHESITTTVEKRSARIEADLTGLGGDPATLAMRETLTVSGQPRATVVYVGKVFYVNLGAATQNGYVTLDPAAPADPLSKVAGSVTASEAQADPTAITGQLKDALLYVQAAGGTTRVDGVATTPYLVGVKTTALTGILGPLIGSTASLPAQLDVDFWVGADGLPRRSSLVIDNIDEETYYTHWGKRSTITAPGSTAGASETAAAGSPDQAAAFALAADVPPRGGERGDHRFVRARVRTPRRLV